VQIDRDADRGAFKPHDDSKAVHWQGSDMQHQHMLADVALGRVGNNIAECHQTTHASAAHPTPCVNSCLLFWALIPSVHVYKTHLINKCVSRPSNSRRWMCNTSTCQLLSKPAGLTTHQASTADSTCFCTHPTCSQQCCLKRLCA
jgi:hypothetical protein